MSFMDIDTSDAIEPRAVPGDEEYEIRLIDMREGIDKNGNGYSMPRFDIPSVPAAKDFTKFYGHTRSDMSEKELNSAKWAVAEFKKAFGIPDNERGSLDKYFGSTAWAVLGAKEDLEYGEQNYIKRFVRSK